MIANKEIIMIVVMGLSAILFSLGGTGNWAFANKLWRRIGVPLTIFFGCLIWNPTWWFLLIACALLALACFSGYGEKKSWWFRIIVFAGFYLPSLLVGFSWWVVIAPVLTCLMFLASNWLPLAKTFYWKCVEFNYGALIAITFLGAVQNPW